MQRIAVVFAVTAVAMWLTFGAAQWYSDASALPRYCEEPDVAIENVRKILTTKEPVGSSSKRPYAVAAKLIFLVPRADSESIDSYLDRLLQRIDESCRT